MKKRIIALLITAMATAALIAGCGKGDSDKKSEGVMTYEEYIAQQQQAIDEETRDDSCFIADVPECQFVRGH